MSPAQLICFIWFWLSLFFCAPALSYPHCCSDLCAISRETKLCQFSRSVVSDSLRPHGLQHARLPCPSPTPGVYSNSCLLHWWCHPTLSSSVNLYTFSLSQHQGLFEWISSLHQVAKVLEFQLQHQVIYTLQKNPPTPKSFSSITSLLNGFLFIQELFLRTFDIHR